MYSKGMTIQQFADYFNIRYYTATKYNPKISFAVVYDAFHNIKTLKKRKEWLYALNPNEKMVRNTLEDQLDAIWEGYIKRLEYEEQLKEEQYESGNIDWKLNKGFRG